MPTNGFSVGNSKYQLDGPLAPPDLPPRRIGGGRMNAREQADPLGVSSDLLWWGSRNQLGLSNRTDQDALTSR